MKRLGLAFVLLALATTTGCRRKHATVVEAGADAAAVLPSAMPTKPPPEYSAPEAAAGDVFLIAPSSVIHIDPKGKVTREAKTSLLDITAGPGGDFYGLTTTDIRKLTKGVWKPYGKHGDKTATALILAKGPVSFRVTPGARATGFHILTPTQLWEGALDENLAIGGEHGLSNAQLDGAGHPWGISLGSKLVTRKLTDYESPSWTPVAPLAFAARSGKGAFALTADRVVFNAPDDTRISVTLPFTATAETVMRVGPTDVCVVRSNDQLAFVTPNGGLAKATAKLSDVWTVDGRGRIWTLEGGDLDVIGVAGHVIATKKLAAAMKPAEVTRLVVFGSGASL